MKMLTMNETQQVSGGIANAITSGILIGLLVNATVAGANQTDFNTLLTTNLAVDAALCTSKFVISGLLLTQPGTVALAVAADLALLGVLTYGMYSVGSYWADA